MSHEKLNEEDAKQAGFLRTPIGQKGSGRVRYAAAMYFFRAERISTDLLEVYRICAKFDYEDPISVARSDGIDATAVIEIAEDR